MAADDLFLFGWIEVFAGQFLYLFWSGSLHCGNQPVKILKISPLMTILRITWMRLNETIGSPDKASQHIIPHYGQFIVIYRNLCQLLHLCIYFVNGSPAHLIAYFSIYDKITTVVVVSDQRINTIGIAPCLRGYCS